jgi:hypothetical protein
LFLVALLFFVAPAATAQAPALDAKPDDEAQAPSASVPRTAEESLAALRPVLIGKRHLDPARQRLAVQLARMSRAMEDPGQWFEDNALVVRAFIADVQVMYALEFADGAQLVSHGMMRRWGLDQDRLHQRALANLEGMQGGELRIKPVGKLPWLHVIDAEDGYAASRVLLHWRWPELTLRLGDALILGMPTRDVVVFTASLQPEQIAQLRETVETVERYQGRPVTRRLFQWTPQGWVEFD